MCTYIYHVFPVVPSQLYPTYTQGEPGVSNTEDGEVMVLDTSLILGSVPLGHGKQPSLPPSFSSSSSNEVQLPSSSPPVGMTLFVDHTGSQDNSQSCVLEHLSCDQSNDLHCGTSKTDDILVLGSLLEIGGRVEEEERRGWQGHREDTEDGRVFSQDSLLQLNQLDVGGTSPRLGLHRLAPSENGVDDVDGRQWYTLHDTEEGRTASANVIVREGRTSLEELTRIHSDRTLVRSVKPHPHTLVTHTHTHSLQILTPLPPLPLIHTPKPHTASWYYM